jgi:excisionase family DNA binding protein
VKALSKCDKDIEIPIWEKTNLTLAEASVYTGIGICKLREISDDETCGFVLWVGSKRLLKRKKLDEYLENAFSV